MPCCENMDLEYMDEFLICKNCYVVNEDDIEEVHQHIPSYKVKHHIAEVLVRLQCLEPGRNKLDMNNIRNTLQGDYSLHNIWKKCNRKHLTYIYCTLNEIESPYISRDEQNIIIHVIHRIKNEDGKKLPDYLYIIAAVCDKYKFEHIKPFIYIKKQNPVWDKRISNVLI